MRGPNPRTRWTFVALFAGLGTLTACGQARSTAGPVRIRVAMHRYLSYAPVLVAKEEGYFADQGLDVELLPFGRSEQVLAAMLSGDVDVWPGTSTPGLLRAIALGAPLRFVGDKGYLDPAGCTYVGLVLRKGLSPEQAGKALRKLNRNREGSYAYVVSRMLASQGISDRGLEFSPLPAEIVPDALGDGIIDAAGTTEPYLSRAVAKGSLWIRGQDILPGYQWGLVLFGPRLLSRDPSIGARFLAAYRRGVAQVNEGKTPRNLRVLSRATGMTEAELQQACWPSFREDGRIDLKWVLEYQEWARAVGALDTTAAPAALYDSSFVVASDRLLDGSRR